MFGHDDQDEKNKPEDQNNESKPAEVITTPPDIPKDDSWQHPGPPPDDNNGNDSDDKPVKAEESRPKPHDNLAADLSISQSKTVGSDNSGNDLIDLKQEALTKLSPLVSHLDQSPAEKFRTLMMMIQASDDQNLVREAYEAALKIDDEKERARALLDVVNEINYFTQNSGNGNNAD